MNDPYAPQPTQRQQQLLGSLQIPKYTDPLGSLRKEGPISTRFGAPPRPPLGKNWMPQATRRLAASLNKNLASGLVRTA
jgi:hypothetical protein